MKRYLLITFLMLFCILQSCRKAPNHLMMVKGRIIDTVERGPIAHTTFILYCTNDEGFGGDYNIQKIPVTTDAHGKFISFFTDDGFVSLHLVWPEDAERADYFKDSSIASYTKALEERQSIVDMGELYISLKNR